MLGPRYDARKKSPPFFDLSRATASRELSLARSQFSYSKHTRLRNLGEKAKNLATKEDIAAITAEIEKVNSPPAKP